MRALTNTTRVVQIGVLTLLLVSLAQVLWWTLDEAFFTADLRQRFIAHWEDDRRAANRLLAHGESEGVVEQIFPHLVVTEGFAAVRPESLEALESERYHRLRRYGWEASFFITVLVASMGVVGHAVRQDALLRRRQQNFIATVSHEFKSPLASLQLSAETMALRELTADRRQVLVERILDDVRRMENMASKILNTSRLEQGRVELNLETVSLGSSVEAAVTAIEERAREGRVELEIDVPEALLISADPMATRTVVQNLLENAVQATTAVGGGEVRVRGKRSDGRVELEVRDTGIGFEPRDSRRLFEKFYRSGDELRRTSAGTGLGLFIVERLMYYHRGSVRARSDGPGTGAVFTVYWPGAVEESR